MGWIVGAFGWLRAWPLLAVAVLAGGILLLRIVPVSKHRPMAIEDDPQIGPQKTGRGKHLSARRSNHGLRNRPLGQTLRPEAHLRYSDMTLESTSSNPSISTEQIWDLLSARLRSFLVARVADEQVSEDLLQETFIRIHQRLDRLDDAQRMTPWVFQIARNLVIDHYRAQARAAAAMAEEVEASAGDGPGNLNEQVMGWLPQMIAELPDTYREAVELYELQDLPQREIADRLGISLSGAKSRIQRGRALLKSRLFQCCSFERDRRGNLIGYSPNRADSCECGDEALPASPATGTRVRTTSR